jgi:hypothetical protein
MKGLPTINIEELERALKRSKDKVADEDYKIFQLVLEDFKRVRQALKEGKVKNAAQLKNMLSIKIIDSKNDR